MDEQPAESGPAHPSADHEEQVPFLLPVNSAHLVSALSPALSDPTAALLGGIVSGFAPPPYELVPMEDASAPSPYRQVLSDEGRGDVKESLFTGSVPIQCPVTLKDIQSGDRIATLPCGHSFEPEGIKRWLEDYDAKCPVCRRQLPSHEKRVETEEAEEQQRAPPDLTALVRSLARLSLSRRQEESRERVLQMLLRHGQ